MNQKEDGMLDTTTKTEEPRIPPTTPIADLAYCHRGIVRSANGPCHVGKVLMASDPLVIEFPECFVPLMDRIDYLAEEAAGLRMRRYSFCT
jgi:hypothetical protein